ncbi:MAG: hypothetical protein LBF58_06065 [Deltaproteobacteria bacterium]|jgi:hypothetical protein|nr:hypothetical protein [Deltaproteobacteria bacterium]
MLRKFWQDTAAGLGIAFALALPTLVVLSAAVVQTTSLVGFNTRLHQSDAAANLFLTKIEKDMTAQEKQTLLNSWLESNMAPTEATPEYAVQNPDAEESLWYSAVSYKPVTFVGGIMEGVFEEYEPLEEVAVERFRYPIEVVVVLDASSSAFGFSPVAAIIQGIEDGFDNLFGDDIVSDDTRVSIFAYNPSVTFTAKHARNLVKPSSRKLYRGTTEAERLAYEKRLGVLAEWGLPDDLLAPGAPGVDVDLITLLRKPLKPGSKNTDKQGDATAYDVAQYAEHADDPIVDLEADGFEMATADGRNFHPGPYYTANYTQQVGKGTITTVLMVNRDRCILTGCPRDSDLYKYLLVPKSKVNETVRNAINPNNTTAVNSFINSIPNDEFIGATAMANSIMPIMAGSNDKRELLNHMRYYNKSLTRMQMGTALDEPLMWASRLLSPNYSDVWEVSEDFPARYDSPTEKRLIFYAGFPSAGYTTAAETGITTGLCNKMIANGVQIYMLGESGDFTGNVGAAFKACTQPEKYPDRHLQYTATNAAAQWTKAFTRQYYVRLAKSS